MSRVTPHRAEMPWSRYAKSLAQRKSGPGPESNHLPGRHSRKEVEHARTASMAALTRMITSYWTARAIYAAAKLRVADYLEDGPRPAEELAVASGVAPRPLYRVLRALAGVGVFTWSPRTRRPSLPPPASTATRPRSWPAGI
jgi:hypothetical protein